jgi:S1-C subfamily serine protease
MKISFIVLVLMLVALSPPVQAQAAKSLSGGTNADIDRWSDSVVRILTQDGTGSGIETTQKVVGDQTLISAPCESGTGFLINNAGYIVTNNHVASRDGSTRDSHLVCVVIETATSPEGTKRYLHKATLVWSSPDADLAVLQATDMHAQPIPFDTTSPKNRDDVYSLGYPVISDQIAGGDGNFISFMIALADGVNATWDSNSNWDITDLVGQRRFATYCTPTATDGYIRNANLVAGPWFGNDDQAQVPVIQHSLDITPGNSGGPLFSSRGGVIGVVGDGLRDTEDGDQHIHTEYATRLAPLLDWLGSATIPGLDDSEHYYKLSTADPGDVVPAQTPYFFQQTVILILLGLFLALGLEFVILRLTLRRVTVNPVILPPVPSEGRQVAHPPTPSIGALLTGTKREIGGRLSSGTREILNWIPLHLPHSKVLTTFYHRPWLSACLGLLVMGVASYGVAQEIAAPPKVTVSPVHPFILKLSPSELAGLQDADQVQPPAPASALQPANSSTTGQPDDDQTIWKQIAWGLTIFWHVAAIGFGVMIIWRVLLAVLHYVTRRKI